VPGIRTQSLNEPDNHRQVLQVVQPALASMMDGSVSTLAPLFATALATRNSHTAFLVGVAAAVGAGISMAFAEALSDDGSVTGRGNAWVRGLVEGRCDVIRRSGPYAAVSHLGRARRAVSCIGRCGDRAPGCAFTIFECRWYGRRCR
jgi:hypothetical protein